MSRVEKPETHIYFVLSCFYVLGYIWISTAFILDCYWTCWNICKTNNVVGVWTTEAEVKFSHYKDYSADVVRLMTQRKGPRYFLSKWSHWTLHTHLFSPCRTIRGTNIPRMPFVFRVMPHDPTRGKILVFSCPDEANQKVIIFVFI